jgi:hypothetical protein
MLDQWHGYGASELEAEIRKRCAGLAALAHMRPELAALFRTLANPGVNHMEVLTAFDFALEALKDVERFVSGEEQLAASCAAEGHPPLDTDLPVGREVRCRCGRGTTLRIR